MLTRDAQSSTPPLNPKHTHTQNKKRSSAEVTRAYRRLALRLHPDKNPQGGEEAARSFQALQRIYAVLGDVEKRAIYDETGSLQDAEDVFSGGGTAGGGRSGADLYAHYRAAFRQVTEEDLLKFAVSLLLLFFLGGGGGGSFFGAVGPPIHAHRPPGPRPPPNTNNKNPHIINSATTAARTRSAPTSSATTPS